MATVPVSAAPSRNALARKRACTHCGSDEIYRQRPRGLIERHVARAFQFEPYWCASCDRRCYLRLARRNP
jgi:hypothetical protein